MPLTTVILQELQFPQQQEFGTCSDLFFRDDLSQELPDKRITIDDCRWDFSVANGMITNDRRSPFQNDCRNSCAEPAVRYDRNSNCLVIPAGKTADLSCYFNMLSANKWFEFTYVRDITLTIEIEGKAYVDLVSYTLPNFTSPQRIETFNNRRHERCNDASLQSEVIFSSIHSSANIDTLQLPIGQPNATLIGIVITAMTETRLYGGNWLGTVESSNIRNVDICLVTTTFQKEDFISRNINILKSALASNQELADHLRVFIIDNGRTLNPDDFEDTHVSLFANVNAGGSGGFARGMIEAIQLTDQPTHILVMDDDVLILPESIQRTYTLLQVLRPEYQNHFISGAMLRLESMDVQHEDIGFVSKAGFYSSKKGPHTLANIIDCAFNEVQWPDFDFEYAGWWYCCIPMRYVTKQSLPIPFFVRGDDVEFSIRNNVGIISLNGVCVWHMGFFQKFNASMEYYQVIRNSFILQALHPQCAEIDFMGNCLKTLTRLLCKYAYDSAELVLDALEDYLDGPEILMQPNYYKTISEKAKKNEQLLPLSEIWLGEIDFAEQFSRDNAHSPRSIMRRILVALSQNGQLFAQSCVADSAGFAPYDYEFMHEPLFFKRKIICIKPEDASAIVHERNQERFTAIQQRKKALLARYHIEHKQIDQAYREAYSHFTSISFWKEYLEI